MKFIHTSLSLAVFAVLSAPSLAQQAMEEVVVTSTKRAESIQDVPLSVSVISGEIMERAEVRDLLDLQSLVPSLRVPQPWCLLLQRAGQPHSSSSSSASATNYS